jgi:hypothetical protein
MCVLFDVLSLKSVGHKMDDISRHINGHLK